MKSSLAHLSPTVLAFGVAIGLSLSLFLLSGAGLQGEATPLLPALGGAAKRVALNPPTRQTPAPAAARSPVSTGVLVVAPPTTVSPPRTAAPRVHPHPAHRAHPRAGVVRPARPAPTPQAPVVVAAPAPAIPVSAPQPISAPRGKALGHQRGHAATAPVTGARTHGNGHAQSHQRGRAAKAPVTSAPAHGNGHARGHSPEHHHGLPPGQAKKAPAAPPKAGGPPADHGSGNGNGNNGGNGHKGGKK